MCPGVEFLCSPGLRAWEILGSSFQQSLSPLESRDCLLGTLLLVYIVRLEASSWVGCDSGME